MKTLGILAMILGVLSTLSSTFFTVIQKRYDPIPVILFWVLLSGFEFIFAWVWLCSKTHILQHSQKLVLAALALLMLVWLMMVLINTESNSIFTWALKTLNYSGLYFIGLIIYYREGKTSGDI